MDKLNCQKVAVIVDVNNCLFWETYRGGAIDQYTLATCFIKNILETVRDIGEDHISHTILAFESGSNWRKRYTKDYMLPKQYKGNRDNKRDNGLKVMVYKAADLLKETLKDNTKLFSLYLHQFEGDDIIAACTDHLAKNYNVKIISTDNDFKQLYKYDSVDLFDISKMDYKDRCDPEYFMFRKLIRGDQGDHVASAYPRLYETKIEEAFKNPRYWKQLLEHEFVNKITGEKVKTKDMIEHNKRLMDLSYQPDELKIELESYIKSSLCEERGTPNSIEISKIIAKLGANRPPIKKFFDIKEMQAKVEEMKKQNYNDFKSKLLN